MKDLNAKLDAILTKIYSISGIFFMLLSAYSMLMERGTLQIAFLFFTGCYFNLLSAISEKK